MSAAPLPSLSQVRSWHADGLGDAARSWTNAAQVWDDAYWQVYQEAHLPGGTEWTGAGADAARARVARDRNRVGGAVHELRAAPAAARTGASQLNTARELVLAAVNEARAAGFDVGEEYSVTSRGPVSSTMHAAAQAQAQTFAAKIRARVLALMTADREAAARISAATAGLNALNFDPGVPERSPTIQTAGFGGMPLPEKPPNPVPEPRRMEPRSVDAGSAEDGYGHASDPVTGHDPRGLRLGASDSDGVPVIYDPRDNVLIVRDTRPNAPDGGTVFKPKLATDPNFVDDKFGWHESICTPGQLADGPITAPAPATRQGNTGVPGGSVVNNIDSAAPPAPAHGGRCGRQLGRSQLRSSDPSRLGHVCAARPGRRERRPDRHPGQDHRPVSASGPQ